MFKSVKKSILNPRPLRDRVTRTCRVRGIDDKNTSAFKVILERERSELSRGSRNIMAISLNQMYHPGSSANELTLKAKDDESGCLLRCWKRWFSACCSVLKYPSPEAGASTSPARGEVLKSALVFSVFMLFSAVAQAKVCFLPDSNCGGVNYGYTDKSGSTCTYKTREEANLKKGECETVQKQGFCFYLSCSMSKSDCDKAAANAPNHDKCCVPCGNCWKVADCSIPQIETCTGANYETEQTCKNKNQNFKPNGKFDKNGTACGECKDVPYITCPEMGDNYVTRAECTAKGSSFTFASSDVKDSDGNECGTCKPLDQPTAQTCKQINQTYKTSCSAGESLIATGERGSDGVCVTCGVCKTGNVKETKYLYLLDELVATNSEGGTLNLVEFWTSEETAQAIIPVLYGGNYNWGCDGHSWQLTYKGNWHSTQLPHIYSEKPVNFYSMPGYLEIWYSNKFPWLNGVDDKYTYSSLLRYSLPKSTQSYDTTALCNFTLEGPIVNYQIKCVTSRDDIKISEKICEMYGFSKNSQSMRCGNFDDKCYTESCPNHPEYKKRMQRELQDGCATFIEGKEGCTSCKDGYFLENNFCRKATECRCEKEEYINGGRGSICVQCPTECQLINYRCLK